MTQESFISICKSREIDPSDAIKSKRVQDLLKRDYKRNSIINELNLNEILGQEFQTHT